MTYRPPVSQILLAMKAAGAFQSPDADLSPEDAEAILTEAGRIAADRIAPLNRTGDRHPAVLNGAEVTTPPGWRDAYAEWRSGGWNGLTAPAEYGGQELPMVMAVACTELWNSACMSFALCPLLTGGAIEALSAHASPELRERYLPNLISGEWSGTMNLTEPQAGSDLSLLRCAARRDEDGGYRITGNKIFITYGEHDCTTNIIHLVLARLLDALPAPAGCPCSWYRNCFPTGLAMIFIAPAWSTSLGSMVRRPVPWSTGTRAEQRAGWWERKTRGSPACSR